MSDSDTVNVVVEQPAEPAAAAADTSIEEVSAAAAAVALAEAQAAAAELDAAERLRRLEAEGEAWRGEFQTILTSVSDSLRTLREEELQVHASERAALSESLNALEGRLTEMEGYLSSIRSASEGETESAEADTSLAAAAATVGPLGAEASLDASGDGTAQEATQSSDNAHPVRKRRWI